MKKLKFKTIVSVFLSAVVFWSLAVPMMSYATPADFSGNRGFLLAEDIEELEQKVAPGPDYEEGDLIALKVIDVPLETFDTVGQTPSLRADCTENQRARWFCIRLPRVMENARLTSAAHSHL